MLQKAGLLAPQAATKASDYRPDIDGLRAIAVLSVVGFHAFPAWLPGGFIGVDIFFVISGYLISGHIFAALELGTFSFAGFYARRIRRIFPALCAVLLACLAFGWIALLTDEYLQLGKHVAAGAGFISNLVLWQESGYFDNTAATKPLLHLWSLGVEEQFYIFWPLLAWAIWKLRANLLAAIVLLAGISFALNINFLHSDPVLDFYSPLTRFWELLAGAALAQHEREKGFVYSVFGSNAQSLAGATLLLCGFAFTRADMPFPGWVAAMSVLGAVFLIAAGPDAAINRIALASRPFVAVGLISYPLYLWHWPLLSFAEIVESEFPARNLRIALVVGAVALSAATYFLIEKPLRFGGSKRLKVLGLIAGMALVGGAGLLVYKNDGIPGRPAVAKVGAINAQFVGALWQYTKNDICLNRYPFAEAADYGWWFCIANKDAPPTVMLLGNSFANQLYPGFGEHSRLGQQSILSIGTCPAFEMDDAGEAEASGLSPCDGPRWYHQQQFLDRIITENSSLEYVIIDGLPPKPSAAEVDRIMRRIGFLVKAGKEVVVFTPHLRLDIDIKGCFDRPFKKPKFSCTFSLEDRRKWDEDFAPVIESIKQSHPSVKVFDQNAVFCGETECSLVVDGMPMVRDEYHHLSEYGSRKLAELFADWAESNLPGILLPPQ